MGLCSVTLLLRKLTSPSRAHGVKTAYVITRHLLVIDMTTSWGISMLHRRPLKELAHNCSVS